MEKLYLEVMISEMLGMMCVLCVPMCACEMHTLRAIIVCCNTTQPADIYLPPYPCIVLSLALETLYKV